MRNILHPAKLKNIIKLLITLAVLSFVIASVGLIMLVGTGVVLLTLKNAVETTTGKTLDELEVESNPIMRDAKKRRDWYKEYMAEENRKLEDTGRRPHHGD